MTSTLTPPSKPGGLLKWTYLLPHYLYGWHLGWRLLYHVMMMTHVGRKTGVVRQTVIEAVNYDGSPEGLHAIAQVIRGAAFRSEAEKK